MLCAAIRAHNSWADSRQLPNPLAVIIRPCQQRQAEIQVPGLLSCGPAPMRTARLVAVLGRPCIC